jgi:type III pantothenate kinase
MTFLVIDIGNTRLKWALYTAADPAAAPLAHGAVFHEAVDRLAETQWQGLPSPTAMLGCAVASDAVRRRAEEQLEIWDIEPRWVVAAASAGGLVNGYEHPHRLGSDRWAALVGARRRVLIDGPARPALVVMVGTAVTVDAVSADGRFLGGVILPGFGVMLKALEMGTAGLRVPTGEVHRFPVNTSDALMSGGTYAITGAIERMLRHLREHEQAAPEPRLFISGGAAVKVTAATDLPFEQVDTLILEGLLVLAAERG